MPKISNDWYLGAIDVAGSFGISASLQDDAKPYLKWFFILKVKDKILADRIKSELEIGVVRKAGRKYTFVVERVAEIRKLTDKIDFSLLKTPSTHRTFMLWHGAYLKYRELSAYERRLPENVIPILNLRDDINAERKTPRYNNCEAICKHYGWEC